MGEVTLNPYAYLVDTQGTALDDGLIYVGVANENPVTNPIDLFYDADLTVAAPNPVPTINGFAVQSGSPTCVYAREANYSLKIVDKNGVQVFYNQNVQNQNLYVLDEDGAAPRSIQSKLSDFAHLSDFGAIGDGIYHPLSERYDTLAAAQAAYPSVSITSLTQSIDWAATQAAVNTGKVVYASGHYVITDTILLRAGGGLVGNGEYRYWEKINTGTIFEAYGAGSPARWTDIDGTDSDDFTPLFVFCGDSIALQNITALTNQSAAGWSAAYFVPSVRRCSLTQCYADGRWAAAAIYLDATWSADNTTLNDLHPYVDAVSMNEFRCIGGVYRGHRSVYVAGTTRNPDDYGGAGQPAWIWSPGGTSDLNFYDVAFRPLSNLIDTDAACIKLDAAIDNAAGAGQGIWFQNCFYRASTAQLMFDFDRINRVTISGYGEAGFSNPTCKASFTSRSTNVFFIGRFIQHQIWYDGALVLRPNADNDLVPVSLDAGNHGLSGITVLNNGVLSTGNFVIGGNYIRPQTHNTGRLGRGQLDPIDPQDRRDNSFERAYIKEIRSGFENPLTLQGDTGIEFNPTNSTRRGIFTDETLSIFLNGEDEDFGVFQGGIRTPRLIAGNLSVIPAIEDVPAVVDRTVAEKLSDTINPKDFGAIADGTLHTVAEWIIPAALGRYADLAALQVDYPFVQATTESIDYVATQAAVRQIKQHPDKNAVIQLTGRHVWNRELIIDVPLCIDGGHRVNAIEQLNWTDVTPTSGSYVMITGDGATCRTVRTRRAYRGAHTDPYDTPLSSAINIQADGVTLRNLCVFMQITPSLVTNAANYNLQAAITPTLSGGVGIAPNYWGAPQVYTPKAWADVAGAPAKNWDVGVFIGTRLKTTIESCSFAFFENACVYNDITNIASRPLTDWRGNALPANSVSGSDGMTMTKCYTFGSPYGVRVLGALPKSGFISYGKDYKTSVQLTIATNPTSGDKLLIGGYDYDRVTNLPASGSVFESTTFTFINSDQEAPTGEVGVVIGATTAQTAENLVRAITALLDDNDEGVSALIKPLFNYANYSNETGSSVVLAFARGFSSASLARFLNCFEIRHSNPTAFTVTSGQTDLGGGLYKIVPVVGSDPAPYFWGDTASDFIEDGRGAYGASDMYITECQLFALKRPSISGIPVYVKQIRTDRNWQLDDGGGAAIEIDGLAGNSTRCIQKHFHSKNRVDGQSVLSHIRLGRANAVTLEQCHPDGTVSRPDIYSAAAASYGWLTRTPYTKVTAQVGYGVPRPHPDAARITDGQYQSVGTTRLGNGGIDGYGALIGTRLRIEVPAVTGNEGRADVIGGNSGTASVRLGTTNNLNTFRLQFFGSSGNGYVRNYGGNVLYEVPTGSYHNFQFRDAGTGTTTSRARLTETSLDLLNGLRLGAIGVGGVLVRSGAGSPEGVLTANIGSMYLRTDGGAGTTLYIKESGAGSTGWVAK